MHPDQNTIKTPAQQPSSKPTRYEHPLIIHIFSDIFQFLYHISHPISIKILTFPSPYRYMLSVSDVKVTRQAAPELLIGLGSFRTSQVTFSNLDQCIISRNSISNAVSPRKLSCHPKPHVIHVVPTHAHTCPRHFRFAYFSPHLSMTFSCINITRAPYISLA